MGHYFIHDLVLDIRLTVASSVAIGTTDGEVLDRRVIF